MSKHGEIIRYVAGMGHQSPLFRGKRGVRYRSELRGFTRAVWNRIRIPGNISSRESTISQRKAVWRRALLSLPSPPTCILYPDDYSYLELVDRKTRFVIPQDISLVSTMVFIFQSCCVQTRPTDKMLGNRQSVDIKLIERIEQPDMDEEEHIIIKVRFN